MTNEETNYVIDVCQDIRTEGMKGDAELKKAYKLVTGKESEDITEMMDTITKFTINHYNGV